MIFMRIFGSDIIPEVFIHMIIKETRNISLPHMPDTVCIITRADDTGKRVKLVNISAGENAKIIRIMGPQ